MTIIVIDTETTGLDTTKFECGCILTETGKELSFVDKNLMLETLIDIINKENKRGHNVYIYAHNAEYDWMTLFRGRWDYPGLEVIPTRSSMKLQYLNPILATTTKKPKKAFFLDSYLIFKMPLKDLGKAIGEPKMELPIELLNKENMTMEEFNLKMEYCMQDCRVLMKGLKTLKIELNKLGIKPKKLITSGQIGICAIVSDLKKRNKWFDMTNGHDIKRICPTKYEDAIRCAFRGARCQAFQTGRFENVTYLDVNSLYPYIMMTMKFPKLRTEKATIIHRTNIGIKKVTITIPRQDVGYLPIRYKKELAFPNKEMKATSIWTIEEIRQAERLGYKIEKEYFTVSYDEMENPFKELISKLYEYKKNGNEQTKIIAKSILNYTFGKFGQRSEKTISKIIDRNDLPLYPDWNNVTEFGTKYMLTKKTKGNPRYFVNPIISALITAGARQFLWDHIKHIDKKDLIYCDTDSIMMKNFNKYRNIFKIGNEIGEWKVVYENAEAAIKGKKKYAIQNEVHMAGIHRKDAKKEDFIKGEIQTLKMKKLFANDEKTAGTFQKVTTIIDETPEIDIKEREIIDL